MVGKNYKKTLCYFPNLVYLKFVSFKYIFTDIQHQIHTVPAAPFMVPIHLNKLSSCGKADILLSSHIINVISSCCNLKLEHVTTMTHYQPIQIIIKFIHIKFLWLNLLSVDMISVQMSHFALGKALNLKNVYPKYECGHHIPFSILKKLLYI